MVTLDLEAADEPIMRITRSHDLGIDEARRRAEEVADELSQRFALRTRWQGNELLVKGNGVSGYLTVDEAHIELYIKLGFALAIMEAPIRAAVEQALNHHLD